jgi:flagellar M-ring protein FliF
VQGFFDFVKSLGAARMAAMTAVTLTLIGFFSFLTIRMTAPQMVALFTDLAMDDSSSIIKDLDHQGVEYEIKNDGGIIMVPREKVARLRMKLAENGLPKGVGVGYEIFGKSDVARTIRSLNRVDAARVHLVLPERPLFSRDKVEASASIVLKVNGSLQPAQVRAIRHLVASAVNGLKPERVSVIDESGKLLADNAGDDNALNGASADERKIAYENRLRREVENIVSSVVGPGRARVQTRRDHDGNHQGGAELMQHARPNLTFVIPGRAKGVGPESISPVCDYEFRVRRGACHRAALRADPLATPRNDSDNGAKPCAF